MSLADHDFDEVVEVYAAGLSGGKGRKLNAPLVAGGDVVASSAPAITPDLKWLLYTADQDTATVHELYRVPFQEVPFQARVLPSTPLTPTRR